VPDDANPKIKTFISFSFDLKLLTKLVLNFYLSISVSPIEKRVLSPE